MFNLYGIQNVYLIFQFNIATALYIHKAQVLPDDTTNYVFLPRWWRTSRNYYPACTVPLRAFFCAPRRVSKLLTWANCSGEQFTQVSNLLRWAICSGEQIAQESSCMEQISSSQRTRWKQQNSRFIFCYYYHYPAYNLVLRRTTR